MKSFLKLLINKTTLFVLLAVGLAFSALAQNSDSKGKDFWLTFPGNYDNQSTATLFISGDQNTSGTVTIPGIGFTQNFTVTVGNITSVVMPADVFLTSSSTILNNGIHVVANDEVTVYGLNREQYTTDAYLGLPTDILGTNYINLGYYSNGEGTQVGVVATEDNTTVTFTLSASTDSYTAGVPSSITLNKGQTYFLRNYNYGSDLSGSFVTSNKPIGVFGGHQCANIPLGYYACDYIVEELPPTTEWGKNFVTVPLKTRLNGDTFRFLASEDNTDVSVNGSVVANLNKGQFYETILTTSSQIISSKPILVAQYSNGSQYDGVTSDPFMMLIPPYEQFLNKYTITTPAEGFSGNYVNVVAPSAAVGNIILDGTAIPAASFSAISGSGFSGAQVDISLGVHTLSGALPFGVFVYGYADYDSYGYPGGQSLAPVAIVNNLSLTPASGSSGVNTSACFTALLNDQFNHPVTGVRVDFAINGANDTTGLAFTDSNGKATFCYFGPNAGQDTIVATVGTLSDTSYWTRTKSADNPPFFDYTVTPADGTEYDVQAGQSVNFHVKALDTDAGDNVTLSATGIPPGATSTPALPTSGNPVTDDFSWTTNSGDVGNYTIQYKATDNSGSFVTSNVIISVSSTCGCDTSFTTHVAGVPQYTVKGQGFHTIYLGYGLQSLGLYAVHHGGTPPFTYQWSDGTTREARIVSPKVTTTYTVTTTDAHGCKSTSEITIYVIDVRCTTTPGNIYICNNGETMSVPKEDVKGYLDGGATLGVCNTQRTESVKENGARITDNLKAVTASADNSFTLYPNPARTTISFRWNVAGASNAKVIITDLTGRVLMTQSLTGNNQSINIGKLTNGVYLAKLVTADKTVATSRFMVNK